MLQDADVTDMNERQAADTSVKLCPRRKRALHVIGRKPTRHATADVTHLSTFAGPALQRAELQAMKQRQRIANYLVSYLKAYRPVGLYRLI